MKSSDQPEDAAPVARNFADELRNDVRGLRVLAEWLGSGGYPVSRSQANCRALICLNCPHNQKEKWWEKAKEAIARAIREHMLVKDKLKLRVDIEDEIGMCEMCGCCLRLLVWTPLEHLKKHHADIEDYPDFCWKRNEQQT